MDTFHYDNLEVQNLRNRHAYKMGISKERKEESVLFAYDCVRNAFIQHDKARDVGEKRSWDIRYTQCLHDSKNRNKTHMHMSHHTSGCK